MREYIVFDVETQRLSNEVPGGWGNIAGFGFAVGVVLYVHDYFKATTYHLDPEVIHIDDWHKAGQFECRTLPVAHLIENLHTSPRVVTFNGLRFDYEVLAPYGLNPHLLTHSTFDILRECQKVLGHRVSLENVAQATLGIGKSGDAKSAPKWFREGKIEKVMQYCKDDVDITQRIYHEIITDKPIYYLDKHGREKSCKIPPPR